MSGAARAVFLDKDGTLIPDVPYNVDPARVQLSPEAGAGLRLLTSAGYRLVVVSNQSGVARGLFPLAALDAVEARVRALLAAEGVTLDGWYVCPHHPDGRIAAFAVECDCRKPAPGMVRRAAADLGIAPARSWLVGDILDDIEAGTRAGCRTVLLETGGETRWTPGAHRVPTLRATTLLGAAHAILAADHVRAVTLRASGIEADR